MWLTLAPQAVRIYAWINKRRKAIYAVVESGGKQYKVEPGHTIRVERLGAPEGSVVELEKVLLVAEGDEVSLGKPFVGGAKVVATVLGEEKAAKVIVFKYKRKVRYRRKKGHRQIYTRLAIKEIVTE